MTIEVKWFTHLILNSMGLKRTIIRAAFYISMNNEYGIPPSTQNNK